MSAQQCEWLRQNLDDWDRFVKAGVDSGRYTKETGKLVNDAGRLVVSAILCRAAAATEVALYHEIPVMLQGFAEQCAIQTSVQTLRD